MSFSADSRFLTIVIVCLMVFLCRCARVLPWFLTVLCAFELLGEAENLQAQERKKWTEPQNLATLNTAGDDFAPSYSRREGTLYYSSTVNGYAEFFTSRYETRRDVITNESLPRFAPPARAESPLNQARNNQSYITFAPDGSALLSSFRMTPRRPYLNIFQSVLSSGSFVKPEAVDALNTDDFNAHPALSPSGKTVVFASNRPGGRGGLDLWSSNRDENGVWQPPVNLGDALNSSDDEITPHFASEDSLYFSSNGFGGAGGFEIFLTVRVEGKWQPPTPVRELNSEFDDADFTTLPGNVGVFASNRPGGRGGLDLYVARLAPLSQLTSSAEYKIATQTTFITAEEFAMSDVIPLAPCIVFEPNSGDLPPDLKRYAPEKTSEFSPQQLRPDPKRIYAETLNILGKRMQERPASRITLRALESVSPALARQRFESIGAYLQKVWNIDAKRLTFQQTIVETESSWRQFLRLTGEDAVRCVGISSNDEQLLVPVRIAGVNVLAKPRALNLALDMRPRSILRSWSFALTAENDALEEDALEKNASATTRDTIFRIGGATLPFSAVVPIEPSRWSFLPEELHAELQGVDSLGRIGKQMMTITVYKLPLQQKRAQKIPDKIIDRYRVLLPQSDNGNIELTPEDKALIKEIGGILATAPGATITITPNTFGDKAAINHGERFARAASDEIKRQTPTLLTQSIQIEPTGEISAPETPQERMMQRALVITIERPAQQTPQQTPQQERRRNR